MAHEAEHPAQRELSARRIIGFASYQAFSFFLFYAGRNYAVGIASNTGLAVNSDALFTSAATFERIDLLAMLLCMVIGFALVRFMPIRSRETLFTRPLLYLYAVAMAAGSFAPLVIGANIIGLSVEGLLVGFSSALLLAAWGRTFGRAPMAVSVPEVLVGSLVASLVCLLIVLVPPDNPILHVFRLLPLASVVNIEVPGGAVVRPATVEVDSDEGRELSFKILAGTLLFGLSAGLMAPLATEPGEAAVPYCATSMILFGAFLIGALTLQLSDAFGRGAALNKSYRLAVFIMVAGTLVIAWPLLAGSAMPGESVVLAGYLGLESVLVALFIVLADITAQDAALAFTRGFLALFAGEAIGVLLANVLCPNAEFAVPGLAGILVMLSYVFLFTERDFDSLSQIVSVGDTFEKTCADISERYGLSARESEILAFALRGRTSERIAGELVISKSTVDTHLRRIYAKCGVHSRQELLDLAGV